MSLNRIQWPRRPGLAVAVESNPRIAVISVAEAVAPQKRPTVSQVVPDILPLPISEVPSLLNSTFTQAPLASATTALIRPASDTNTAWLKST